VRRRVPCRPAPAPATAASGVQDDEQALLPESAAAGDTPLGGEAVIAVAVAVVLVVLLVAVAAAASLLPRLSL